MAKPNIPTPTLTLEGDAIRCTFDQHVSMVVRHARYDPLNPRGPSLTARVRTIEDGHDIGDSDVDLLDIRSRIDYGADASPLNGHAPIQSYLMRLAQPLETFILTMPDPEPLEPDTDDSLMPQLPPDVQPDPDLASQASPWLDTYIQWSQRWAPRAFVEFHEAGGLFVLSTTAARRVRIEFGHGVYPSLYMAMSGRTTLWTKSTAANLATGLIREAGLGFLLGHDDTTPQALVAAMTGHVPDNYGDILDSDARMLMKKRPHSSGFRGNVPSPSRLS